MKMRFVKKELKKKAEVIVNKMDPTLKISFLKNKNMPSAAGYHEYKRTIYFNAKELLLFHALFKEKVNVSFSDFLIVVIAHEFGHSTNPKREKYYQEIENIYKDYETFPLTKQIEKDIEFKTKRLQEEKRAWEVAKKYLNHIDKEKLDYIIQVCLKGYENDLEKEKEQLKILKNAPFEKVLV